MLKIVSLILALYYVPAGHLSMTGELASEKIRLTSTNKNMETATFGAGCFWCVEAIFQDLKGVESVVSGYSGGTVKNPTYADVCAGKTGHAEVCRIRFNPDVISYRELLDIFWRTHDPTTLNRQGADVGTQYRSVIFYHNEEQRKIAEESKRETDRSGLYKDPVVTEIVRFESFYRAEDYHQDYFSQNPNQPYCTFTIDPKVKKFKKEFREMIK